MSPYLHFGQISPLEIALSARNAARGGAEDRASFLEELIVRRELAHNHCWYEPAYDRYEGVPAWARKTLAEHAGDPRPVLYSRAQLEAGETHHPYWNASMREMRETGYMHNRMRMFWGKKIVEWSPSPEEAFDTALRINNKFFICGRDANSFTNISWLFGLHDRPWFRRPVFGMVRYMGENTFKKFDADAYVRSVEELAVAEAA
jgi:deoxyribodipyrimidine photo-lyase